MPLLAQLLLIELFFILICNGRLYPHCLRFRFGESQPIITRLLPIGAKGFDAKAGAVEKPRGRAAKVDAKRDYGALLQGVYQGPRVARRGKWVFF